MAEYTKEEHDQWLFEVKELYSKTQSHKMPYSIRFQQFELSVHPNVFSPNYFHNTSWYAERLPSIIGTKTLLEIGTGTGAIAIYCNLRGADVISTDINPAACRCALENYKLNNCSIPVFEGDVYDPLPLDTKVDYIFWNHPFNNAQTVVEDPLLSAGFDFKYQSLKKYIAGATSFLIDPKRGLLLGTGGHADISSLKRIAQENGYITNLLECERIPLGKKTKAQNDFRIYELTREEL